MSTDTDVNKNASPAAEEHRNEADGPRPGSVSDQEKKVRLSPATMSAKNSTDLVEYVDKGHAFLPVIPNTQRSQLEDRLNTQERTIALLLEQAFRIKEDISACLQGTHGFRKEESLARKLLESHIQTITSIVKKLSQNIEILEHQIRARDQAATGTNFAVQELNTRHLQGVGDLRGRVARCDSSIVKLSGDIQFIRHEHQKIEKTIQDFVSALETVSKNLDVKVMQLLGKIEASSSQQTSNLKMVQGDYRHEMNLLEFNNAHFHQQLMRRPFSTFLSTLDILSNICQLKDEDCIFCFHLRYLHHLNFPFWELPILIICQSLYHDFPHILINL
ncbi:protein FAM81B isoform X4 [Crocuta crocuta]